MADHGIIIDVGFQPQIKEFINEIQNEFKKINYDEVIGLSDSFDKQKKEVEKKLKDLSQQIEETLNGKIGSEPLQQIKELQKTVDVLCGGFKELIKTLPKDQTKKLAVNLGNISEIAKVSDKVEIAPFNKKRIDELAESYRALAKAQQLSQSAYLPKKHGNKSYENEELAQKDLNALLKQYNSINKEIAELDKESSDYVSKLDNLRSKLVTTLTELSRLSITLGDLGVSGDTLITPKKTLEQLQDLFEEKLEKLLSYISDRKAKIQAEYTSIGGEGSLEDTLFKKSEAKKDILKIPVSIQNGAQKKISEELNKLITSTNEKFKDTPLLLEVKLVSGVQSKNTQDILNKIRSELKQIDSKEISSALEQLLDQANRQIDNAFIININVATKKASAEIKEFIKQAKEDLGQKVSFDPELVLSKSNIDKFQKQLDNAGFTINLSDFISGISELKTILDSDDSKLIKNLNEIKTISADIKSLFADLSSGKIKINSPIIEGGIVESVELTEEDKKRINEKLQDITIEIKDMLATDQIDDWSNHFINALTKISNEIKVLFGGQANALSDLLEDFNFSDKLMKRGRKDILERSGVIGTDHNMYGFGTYDRTNKNSYVSELANELRNIGVTPSIGYHSHGALKQIAPSVNDIIGSILDGLNAEIIQGLDEIVIFDTKGFLEANKDIDFSKFKKKLDDAENKLATEISNGIDEGLSKSEADEIFTSIFKRRLPEIFENILPKTKYKGKVEDFIQTMSLEDFRNSNPLGLDKESMNSLVQTSGMQKALDVLDQITEKIEVIKSANKDGSLNGAFNLNIDVKQVSVLTDKIQELIDLLGQLPQLFNTAFSSENIKNTKNNSINSQINEIRKEREESQRELDDLLRQIQSLKNPNTRNAPGMSEDIISILKSKAGDKKEIYEFINKLKDNKGELNQKSIKELRKMLSQADIEEETKELIEGIIADKKLIQSAVIQANSINKQQKEIVKGAKSKTKTPGTLGILESARKQQEAQEKSKQERTDKLIAELEAKAALIQQRINSLNQKEQELVNLVNESSGEDIISEGKILNNVEKENDELNKQQSLLKEINELWEQINNNRTKSGNISQSKSSGNLERLNELGSKLRELRKLGGFANLGLSDKDKKVIAKYYNQAETPTSQIIVEPVVNENAFDKLPKLIDEAVPEKVNVSIEPEINKDAFSNLPKLVDEAVKEGSLKDLDKAKNVLSYIRNLYGNLDKTKSGKFSETKTGKNTLDDLGTRLYSYSKYIGKPGEIPNLKKVLGDSDLSEQNEKLILKYYQNAINRAEELNAMLVEAPKLVDDDAFSNLPKLEDEVNTNYSDKDIVFETDAVIQDNAKLVEQYEKEAQVAEKAAEKNKELAKERELTSDKYSDDMLVFETDAVLKDNSKLVEEYQKQDKSVEEIRNELQESLVIEERYLKICKEGSEAYNRRLENIRKIKEELSALVNFTTIGEPQSYGFTMKDSEVDGSKNQPNLVDDTAKETTKALEKESEAMDKVEKAAKKSTKSKKDFAKANKEDAQSADETTTSVLAEAKAMDYLSTDVIDKQSDEFKQAAKTAHDYFKELGDTVSITRTMSTYNAFNKENNSYEKKQRVSYRVVDTEGRSRTFNPQGDLIGSKDVINVTKAYDKLESVMKECYDLELKMQTEKGDAVIENKLVDARERYAKAEEKVNNLRDKGLSIAERELKINEQALAYNEALVQNTQKYYDNRSKRPLTALNKTVVRAEDTVNSELVNNNNGFKDNLRDLIKEAKNVDQHDIDRINELNDAINRLLRSDDAKAAKEGIVTKLMGLREQIARTVTSNTKMSSELRGQFQALAKTADDMGNHIIDFSPADVQKVIQQYKELNTVMISTGQSGDSIWKRISNRLTDMNSKLIAYYLSWQDLIRYIRTAITTIRELDTALVDLRKTTTMSTDELREFYYSANETAQQMGVTTAEIINQAAAWSRLGYSSKEAATEMSALSSQFAQISPGMSVETATDGLVSSMKAFGFEVEDVERNIMDNINRIGNTMATNNEEIVQMLERSSAAMAAANNTIEETIALESAAVQVTRNAETTGTAFRTISMRIRGYDEETEEQLEDYEELKGKIADLTKTAKTPGGISLFSDKDKTTFKSTYQLLKDISEIWDELTDKEQAQLTEKLAGKRGGQVLSSIMNDFSEVERAMTEMSNAAGSSDQEMEIIKDSIDLEDENDQVVVNYTVPQDANGKVEVYVDYMETPSYSRQTVSGQAVNITAANLNIVSPGEYHIRVGYVPNDGETLNLAENTLKAHIYTENDFAIVYDTWITYKNDNIVHHFSYPGARRKESK